MRTAESSKKAGGTISCVVLMPEGGPKKDGASTTTHGINLYHLIVGPELTKSSQELWH